MNESALKREGKSEPQSEEKVKRKIKKKRADKEGENGREKELKKNKMKGTVCPSCLRVMGRGIRWGKTRCSF